MSEKDRKKTRFIANFDGVFRFKGSTDWQNCYIYDISETGTLIRMKQTLIVGDILEISLDHDDKTNIITGKVANVSGQVAGVEFISGEVGKIVDKAIKRAFSQSRPLKKG
ncbi:MAG: PilZ domain-containing protein [Spirochaetales bacterium]|nr:PilZ domain-containing protein [Spirochaetales bacterium]